MKHKLSIKSIFLFQACFLLITILGLRENTFAQTSQITITGTVVDSDQNPLPGATIIKEGTTTGTISDLNGQFELTGNQGNVLIVTFIGYKPQNITVNSSEPLTIVLQEDFVSIGETVVVGVGYGTMRKADLTGAITSVSADEMKKGVVVSSEQLLQGKVAGLTVVQGTGDPASGASVRLRGGTSLSASNGPLIVVDGIPGVDFNTVQPSEIVSIDVLKDASAAAIYGSRGANGVIIVTTNREKKGKITEYNGYVAVGTVSNHLDLLSANQWRQYVRDNNIVGATDYGADTDWQKELEQTSVSQSHNISFSNVNEDGGYRLSFNYLNNEGIIVNSKLERLGASLTAHQYTLNNKLKLEGGIHTNFDKWKPIDNRIFERSYNLSPVIPVFDDKGEFTSIAGTNYENPVEINTNRTTENTRHRLLAYGKVELEIMDGLKATTNVSYEYNSLQTRLYKPTYAVLEGFTDQGYGQRTLGDYQTMQLEAYLTYDTEFEGGHKLNVLGGYSYLDNMYEGFGAERRGFDSDLFLYNNLAAGQDYRAGDVYSYKGSANLISFFARANYNYLGRYMFTATIRDDGSSRFGANDKWGIFPSASIAWRISDENFMSSTSSWLNNLKLRVGYGITGNQDGIGEYKSLSILGAGGDSYYDAETDTWKQSYGPTQNPNPDLKWESTEQINIGLDFSLFNRLNGSLEVYQKKTSDLLYTYAVPQPPYLVGTMLANVGDLSNKGVELTLNSNIMKTTDFSWNASLTLAHNKQEIDKLSNQVYETDVIYTGSLHSLRGMSNQFSQVIKEGYAVGTFWGPKSLGLDEDGNFILENEGEAQDLGSVQPKLSMGFSMNFDYKQFDLEVSTYGMFGQKVLNATAMSLNDPSRLPAQNVPDDFLTSGITDDPTFSDYWIEDASFLRLQTLSLGYTINTQKLGLERVRVYVTGENLFVITGYSGVDPEVSIDGLDTPGIDMFNYYPKPRTFSFGLNVSF